ncbi:MAG: hypothetical protein HZB67_03020 [Candidatus Aenigmarchaeota archaeon]|nr:hypothetical protein [Candidatus Aenigmarchaeota archaeon]
MAHEDKVSLILQELVRRSNEESRRLRSVEQRLFAMESRLQSVETSVAAYTRKTNEKLATFEASIKMQDEIAAKIKTAMEKLSKQTDKYARKSEIKEIEKMFDLVSPAVQQFATRKELEELKRRIAIPV